MEIKNLTKTYLTFKLGKEQFAVNVKQVISILEMQQITEIPNSPSYLRGMINLRGNVLPVVDTRVRFGMSKTEQSANTCIIVLDIETDKEALKVGALVDSVNEVITCSDNEIKPVPGIGTKYHADFLLGMLQQEAGFIMIINTNTVMAFAKDISVPGSEQELVNE